MSHWLNSAVPVALLKELFGDRTRAGEVSETKSGQEFDCATWLYKARELPKEEFRREVEKELTGKDTEPSELVYFKLYKSPDSSGRASA